MGRRSAAIMVFALLFGCDGDDGGECKADSECKGDRICEAGACMDPGAASAAGDGSDSAGESSQSGGGESGTDTPAPSCEESGTYCDSNILYDCITDEVIINCRTCQWVGPGSGTEYDTSCKAQISDCSSCTGEDPWTGPGCYFGGGPAVCK